MEGHIVSIYSMSLMFHLLTNDLLCSLVIAQLIPAMEEEAKVEVQSVTNVVKSGIWLVHARLNLLVAEVTAHLIVAIVRRRLGKHFLLYGPFFFFSSLPAE